jgi:hypothetical protein
MSGFFFHKKIKIKFYIYIYIYPIYNRLSCTDHKKPWKVIKPINEEQCLGMPKFIDSIRSPSP